MADRRPLRNLKRCVLSPGCMHRRPVIIVQAWKRFKDRSADVVLYDRYGREGRCGHSIDR
jgi:hypothetical protein